MEGVVSFFRKKFERSTKSAYDVFNVFEYFIAKTQLQKATEKEAAFQQLRKPLLFSS